MSDKFSFSQFIKDGVDKIMEHGEVNEDAIASCALPHSFGVTEYMTATCSKCGGVVLGVLADWYKQGLRDAQKEDIPNA